MTLPPYPKAYGIKANSEQNPKINFRGKKIKGMQTEMVINEIEISEGNLSELRDVYRRFINESDHLPAIWLDDLAINKKFRNTGYGTLFFNKIIQSKQDGFAGMFLEVEIPEADEGHTREQQIRRINFYER